MQHPLRGSYVPGVESFAPMDNTKTKPCHFSRHGDRFTLHGPPTFVYMASFQDSVDDRRNAYGDVMAIHFYLDEVACDDA